MAFNIKVVNTGSLTVQIVSEHLNNSDNAVDENDPNHVYDRIKIGKLFFSMYDKLSTVEKPVYHRLKYTVTGNAGNWTYARQAGDPVFGFVNLVPLDKHSQADGGFSTAENSYDENDTLPHRILGKLEKRSVEQQLTFTFELQYNTTSMESGVWKNYKQTTSKNIVVNADDNDDNTEDFPIRIRTAYTADNYDPTTKENYDPDIHKQARLYRRMTTKNESDNEIPAGTTVTIGGVKYSTEDGPDSTYPTEVKEILFSDTTLITPRPNVDFVLLLSDDSAGDDTIIDDKVEYTSSAKPAVQIKNHIVPTSTDTDPITPIPNLVEVKLFRGKTTRIFTNLYWPRVRVKSLSVSENDLEDVDTDTLTNFGFMDFDGGETRLGIDRTAEGRVFIIVKLSMHSTSLLLDTLVPEIADAVTNPMNGSEDPDNIPQRINTFANADPNYNSNTG